MTEILITGEGPTDYGWKSFGSNNWHEGAAAKLLRRCAEARLREKGNGDKLTLHFADRKDVEAFQLQRSLHHGLKGKSIPALRFYMLMKNRELKEGIKYFAGVYYCDADHDYDRPSSEHEAKHCFNERYDQISKAATKAKSLSSGNQHTPLIPMVALRMIESWLLADADAFTKHYGCKLKNSLPKKPEIIWGDEKDENSNYPKHVFVNICKRCNNNQEPTRDDYAVIASHADLSVLCEKRGISFKRFYDDINNLC